VAVGLGEEVVPGGSGADEVAQARADPASLGLEPGEYRRDVAEVGTGSLGRGDALPE
jgi:hypothetical protein